MEDFFHGIAKNQFTVKLLVVHLKFKIGLVNELRGKKGLLFFFFYEAGGFQLLSAVQIKF